MSPTAYYVVVILLGVLNVALAGVAYAQRARQIRGGRLHEQQLRLAESRNELAESRLRRLDEQIELMGQIRDTLAAAPPPGSGAAGGCDDYLDPRPWLAIGIVLVLGGAAAFIRARRAR